MVLIWNHLAGGDPEAAAVLVALNACFRSSPTRARLFLLPGPSRVARPGQHAVNVAIWGIARSVLVFLGIPLPAGDLTRTSAGAPGP